MLGKRKVLVFAAMFVLTQVSATSVMLYDAYALPPPPLINLDQTWDISTARGFENVTMDYSHYTPDLVLGQGRTGEINLTFTTSDNKPVRIEISYGGVDPFRGVIEGSMLPAGITYSIEPTSNNITVTPHSKTSIALRISAASNTEVRSYNLMLYGTDYEGDYVEGVSYPTVLTIVEAAPLIISNTTITSTNTITRTATSYATKTITITSIQISTSTSTFTTTLTSTSPSTSISTSSSTTVTTLPTTSTSTTAVTSTETTTDPSTYAWALSATVAAVVLAAVLLLQRRRTG